MDEDVDGDGRADLAVGAKWNDQAGSGAGSVHVFSGADGSPLFTLRGAASGDSFGSSLACAGDIDNDGVNDLIVGALGADAPGTNAGAATVFSGVDGGELLHFTGLAAGDGFGVSVAGVGDMDGDGRADVIVGAHGNDANGASAGCARIFSGLDGGLISEVIDELGLRDTVVEVGLDFQVGIGGSRLSVAQRQKLAIARAVLKRPDVFIVSEGTAALDGATQTKVTKNLLGAFEGRGLIWILHRPSQASQFDRVLVMRGGHVIEQGGFDELDKPDTHLTELMAEE